MKIIKLRERVDQGMLCVAFIFAIMPVIGLVTGTAFSPGIFGSNYQEASLGNNSDRYWFFIKSELGIVLFILFRAKFEFPLIYTLYQNLLNFKDNNKVLAYTILYLIVPVAVVALCLLLIYLFDIPHIKQ